MASFATLARERSMELIKNYTSSVSSWKSIAETEQILAKAGAVGVTKVFDEGKCVGVAFQIQTNGTMMQFKLPSRVDQVEKILKGKVLKPHKGTFDRIKEQSERTAWKLLRDWVEIQVSLIRLGQAELTEVFLPYAWDGKTTFYDLLKATGFKALTDGRESKEERPKGR